MLISPDGRWWWDGAGWRSRTVDGPLSLFWFTSTPDWFARILVIGLIALIPIVGGINLYGWVLVASDMIRRRWKELPPANFDYLERGVAPFVVLLVYGVAVLFIFGAAIATGLVLGISNSARWPLAIVIFVSTALLWLVWSLISLFAQAAALIASDRLGIGRALNPLRILAIARANSGASVRFALTYFLSSLVLVFVAAIVGLFIPFFGLAAAIVLPAIYAMAVPALAEITVDSASSGPVPQPA